MRTDELARAWPVWALAVGQTLGYACFFYIFAALVQVWTRDPGWDKSTLAAGPTLAIALSAVLAPVAGRLVDRGLGVGLLAGGAAVGAVALLWLAQVSTPAGWLIGWAGLGLAQAACLYEVCFAFLIRRLGPDARAAIVRVTLVAGFASTLAFPGFAALADLAGWRGAVLASAGTAAGVILPLHWMGAQAIRRHTPPPRAAGREPTAAYGPTLRNPVFWGMGAVFAIVSLNHWMMMSFLVPVFVAQGAAAATAVFAASTVGPAQVAGRLVLMRLETRIGNAVATLATLAATVVAVPILWAADIAPGLILAYALMQGAAMGVMTILRPVLIAGITGPTHYGALSGIIQIPVLAASAAAPTVGALILDGPGVPALLALSFGLAAASLAAVWALTGGGRG
jgi:MFS family permease